MLNGTTSQSSGSVSVISDNTILSQEHYSAPHDMAAATESIEEVQAGKKIEIVSVVRYDISMRSLIIIFIAITVQIILLSSFKNYL